MHPFRGTVTNSQADLQAEMLANRVFKKFNQLWPRFKAKNTGVFRLYDQDIPEIRMLVDAYVTEEEGLHLVLAEYEREQTKHLGDWLERMAQAVGKKLELEPSCLHLKTRRTRPESGERHTGSTGPERLYTVREGSLKFRVDLDSFIDTGLFGDHRKTRALFAKEAAGKRVLNLFCYTGAFTVYAAKSGASSTLSIDTSSRYLGRLSENLALNKLSGPQHRLLQQDVRSFLMETSSAQWDLCICDPPSFSTRPNSPDFDLQRDHPKLIARILPLLAPSGVLWFSTNHQRFVFEPGALQASIQEWTARTLPEDFPHAHHCWRITKAAT